MDEEPQLRDDTTRTLRIARVAIWVAGIGTIFALSAYILRFSGELSADQAVWGQFGDYLGGTLNPFFAFLTIFLLVVTLAVQTRELEATRKQAADSAKSLRLQTEALEQQVFEQTFFQLLSVFNDVLASTEFNGRDGRHAMHALRGTLQGDIASVAADLHRPIDKHDAHPDDIRAAYRTFYGFWEPQLGPYFRTLYNILKFVSTSTVSDKRRYTNVLRAQLSSQELDLVFCNLLGDWSEKMRPLAAEFALLKHLPVNKWSSADARRLLDPRTFAAAH